MAPPVVGSLPFADRYFATDTLQTPSPHRFLTGNRRHASPAKRERPSPAPREQSRAAVEHHASQAQPTSSQFAPTPRFGKTKPSSDRPPSPSKPVLAQALRASIRPAEAVEDTVGENDDEEMLDDTHAVPTIEQDGASTPWTNDLALSPKRRRLDVHDDFSSPGQACFKHPQTPASHFAKAVPRVQPPPTHESISTQRSDNAAPRPAFLRSSVAPSEPSEPLPDAFSPHRRGQKFVPGGMAATMQQWVLETGQAAVQSRKGQGYLRGEDYVMRLKVEIVGGDGPHVVKTRSANGESVSLVLARSAQVGAVHSQEVTAGRVVGVRAPSWDIDIDGEHYAVAVDWKILQ